MVVASESALVCALACAHLLVSGLPVFVMVTVSFSQGVSSLRIRRVAEVETLERSTMRMG